MHYFERMSTSDGGIIITIALLTSSDHKGFTPDAQADADASAAAD